MTRTCLASSHVTHPRGLFGPRVAHVGGLKCSSPKSPWPQSKRIFTFLGDADGTTSHANSQSVHTCIYEVLGLSSSDYYSETERLMRVQVAGEPASHHQLSAVSLTIASDDLEIRVLLLDVSDHIDLEDGISLGRVLEQEGSSSYTVIWPITCRAPPYLYCSSPKPPHPHQRGPASQADTCHPHGCQWLPHTVVAFWHLWKPVGNPDSSSGLSGQ